MDLDNMMITPAMYQDIPSSFMMQPMPMMGMYGTMMPYPTYGVSPMQPQLANDKFERIQAKDNETKHTMRNTGIALAALTAAGFIFSKKLKIKNPELFKKIGTAFKSGYDKTKDFANKVYDWTKNIAKTSWNKLTGLFKKTTT